MVTKRGGFTIIEVVLVLAVAGLIFLIVFLSIGALQRAQRDTQRRSDLGKMLSDLTTFAANHGGVYPGNDGAVAAFNSQFIAGSDVLKEPLSGNNYTVVWGDLTSNAYDIVFYNVRSRCIGGGIDVNPSGLNLGLNQVAIEMKLETGSYCLDTSK